MTAPMLEMAGIGKAFPGVTALNDVSLTVAGGEVRALMGENGAGKSTLLKILAGEHRPDTGEVRVRGAACRFGGPRDSAAAGVAVIHQELHLVPEMTVAENLCLGAYPARGGWIDSQALRRRAEAVIALMGEDLVPDSPVKTLPIGKRQMIEIGKALLAGAQVIAFDEPTSSLSARETETLMRLIRDLKADGRAILYVSHRMDEVFALCDSVTILRDGRLVADHPRMADAAPQTLITEMAGRPITDVYGWRPRKLGPVALKVEGLQGRGLAAPVDLEARRGEIFGLFGLVGAGRSELFRLIYGAERATAGAVGWRGGRAPFADPRAAIRAGVALCPEDRKAEGVIPQASVRDNVVMARRNLEAWRRPVLRRRAEDARARELIGRMRVKTPSGGAAIQTLSGGNQQKAILARWLDSDADLLLLDEPTRGIDVGARSEIYGLMYGLAERGKTLLIASSDLPEVIGVSDRILVMREGAVSAIVDRADAAPESLLRLALPDRASANARTTQVGAGST